MGVSIIAAITQSAGRQDPRYGYGIGIEGKLPWNRLQSDMRRFKRLTIGHPVIMGRKTWESIPERFRPLQGRTNIVLTRNSSFQPDGGIAARTFTDAIRIASEQPGAEEIFVIGGEAAYEEAWPFVDTLYVTRVERSAKGCNAFFPSIPNGEWHQIAEGGFQSDAEHDHSGRFYTYIRRSQKGALRPSSPRPRRNIATAEARTEAQVALYQAVHKVGECPFCPEHFAHPHPPVAETESWVVIENVAPYEGTRVHLVILHRSHITEPEEVTNDALDELHHAVIPWAKRRYQIAGGSFLMRFGNMDYNGSSVDHLHAHLIVGGPKQEGVERIRVKVGYHVDES